MNGNASSSVAIPARIPIGGKAGTSSASSGGALSCKGVEDLELLKTIGTGTFARVYLCRHRRGNNNNNGAYAALKILGKHDVIRLKQVEHVKNERQILSDIKVGG